jgi:hypothetical protein
VAEADRFESETGPIFALWPVLPLASRQRLVKQHLPNVLALAGAFVLAIQQLNLIGDVSFPHVRLDGSERERSRSCRAGAGRGLLGILTDIQAIPILSETAGARGRTQVHPTA